MSDFDRESAENTNENSNIRQESARETSEISDHMAQIGTDIAQSAAEITQQAAQSTLDMATQLAERSVDQFERAFGFSERDGSETAQQSLRNIEAITECTTVLVQSFQDISREGLDWAQQRFRKHLDGLDALLRCRTPQDVIAAQSDLMRGNLELLLTSSRRIAERAIQAAEEATRKITVRAEAAA